ncbi:MAG: AAA family ATPase [Clostridia bacterium]|nr:AAA family ATPase [Clostridia bacterium]
MKNLYFIGGTMGAGKTTTGQILKRLLPKSVFLDGDWCWDADPFVVTDETKKMCLENIGFLLNNFIECSEYENVIFAWVMNSDSIIESVTSRLMMEKVNFINVSLVLSEEALVKRLKGDVDKGIRTIDVIKRSVDRLPSYRHVNARKLDVTDISATVAARRIMEGEFD